MGEVATVSSLQGMLNNVSVKKRFEEMLGSKSAGFISSIMTVTNGNAMLQKCDPKTILSASSIAATLDLPINPNLGFAALVPYKTKIDGKFVDVCQFQMQWKGFVQLAMRTGQYKALNASEVYEGELVSRNRITGEITFDFEAKTSDKIIGYCAYMKLINGFEKYLYMTVEEIEKHAKKYSKTYAKGYGTWVDNKPAMSLKTVMKMLISKYGILSIDMQQMQTAVLADQSVVNQDEHGNSDYNYGDNTIDVDVSQIEHVSSDLEAEFAATLNREAEKDGVK